MQIENKVIVVTGGASGIVPRRGPAKRSQRRTRSLPPIGRLTLRRRRIHPGCLFPSRIVPSSAPDPVPGGRAPSRRGGAAPESEAPAVRSPRSVVCLPPQQAPSEFPARPRLIPF